MGLNSLLFIDFLHAEEPLYLLIQSPMDLLVCNLLVAIMHLGDASHPIAIAVLNTFKSCVAQLNLAAVLSLDTIICFGVYDIITANLI